MDLEALEQAVHMAALGVGAEILEELLRPVGVGRREEPVVCGCGAPMVSKGVRAKKLQTLLGKLGFARSRYKCTRCKNVRYPADEELGIEGISYSPGVQRQVARLGAKESFQEVSKDMAQLAGLSICRKQAERIAEGIGQAAEVWLKAEREALRLQEPPPPEAPKTLDTLYIEFDGTGVPMVPHELAGRQGKEDDGSAKTREAKVGCVFTQTNFDEEGRPVRDNGSASFVVAIEPAAQFQWRMFAEAQRRGLYNAKRVVCVTDGAEWIRNIIQTHFPSAIHVIDLYHAREHLIDLCRLLFDRDLKRLNRYKDSWWEALDNGEIEKIAEEARSALPKDEAAAKEACTAIGYFETNKERMRYGTFIEQGLFVGSGVIESACRTIVGQRLKQAGMEWTISGANAILALRALEQSGRTEDYWEARAS